MKKSIFGNRCAQNWAKRNNIPIEVIRGEWNGYGCPIVDKQIELTSALSRQLNKYLASRKIKKLTPEEKIERWAKRLHRLTGVSVERAQEIAKEKMEYKRDCIDRQLEVEVSSFRIPAWKKKAERDSFWACVDPSTLLDRIQDTEHAHAILAASHRHNNTNYEDMLEEAREQAALGNIDRDEVQEYARANFS